MENGETIPSGISNSSDMSSPEPRKANTTQGINTFLKENDLSVSPMNLSSKFTNESFSRPIDPPQVLSLVIDSSNNPKQGAKQEGFYENFQNMLQSLNGSSGNNAHCFSELEIASQNMNQQQGGIREFDSTELFSQGMADHSKRSDLSNQSTFQRAYQNDQSASKAYKNTPDDSKKSEIQCDNNNQDQEQVEEINTKSQDQQPSQGETCKCTNSKCLKLYCVCFSHGTFCSSACKCISCSNKSSNEAEVKDARKNTLTRNPHAFTSKVEVVLAVTSKASNLCDSSDPDESRSMFGYKKGCKCKRTFCRKKYCECFNAGVKCSYLCICEECQNKEDEKDEIDQKVSEGKQNSVNQGVDFQEKMNKNKRPHDPSIESSEGIHQGSEISHETSETSYSTGRKILKVDDTATIEQMNNEQLEQQQLQEDKNQQKQLQEAKNNQQNKQIFLGFETPTFKVLDKQNFDPNSFVRKNVPNSNFSLDS